MLQQLTADSRKDDGALRVDVLIQEGHPNHFHLIEAWHDRHAREAHAFADHTRQFRTKLVPFEGALYDERLFEPAR
jgi:quinol monooxygenase YgiN